MEKGINKRNAMFDNFGLYSKIPPQARELEEAVLGSILIERDAMGEIADILKPDVFYVDAHKTIFEYCLNLYKASKPIDLLSVTEELRKESKLEEVGGAYYLSELTNKIGSSANIEYHARIIIQRFLSREIIRICNDSTRDAYEDTTDVFELIDTLLISVNSLNENTADKGFVHIGDRAMDTMTELETIKNSENKFIGVPCGIKKIDNYFYGFRNSDLIIVGARPSMGKTALGLSIAYGAAELGIPVAFASLEMSTDAVRKRLVAIDTNINLESINNATYNDSEGDMILQSLNKYKSRKSNIYIDDKAQMTVSQLRSKVGKLVRNKGVKMLIVDYLQLMRSGEKGLIREQEIGAISRGLKAIAKDLNIPVIALAQLSRGLEHRGGDKKPMLSDLRESGSIEQDADVVMFPHRPEYYNLNEANDGSSLKGVAELIIAKFRNGKTGTIPDLAFIARCAKFADEAPYWRSDLMSEMVQQPVKESFDIF
jgi:replicative DNA helicase